MTQSDQQRVAVVTGASSGIGKATAIALAKMGWHVIGTGRTPARCDAAEAEIRAVARDDARVDFLRGDMALMAETKRIAEEIAALTPRLDILINNAGGVRDQRYITSEGGEETFTANHLAPFLLTRELMPLLKAAAAHSEPGDVRVIAVASKAYLATKGLHWDDLQHLTGDFPASGVYCEVKLANVLFTRELDRRIAADGMVAQALTPGPVSSNFFAHGDKTMQEYGKSMDALSPEEVAETLVWMSTAPELGSEGGRTFYAMVEEPLQPHGADDEAAARLWTESEKILANMGF
jgi:NAD(P)-dependent dehydrogenase (short-subunit alcohol dehydrogenase family)